MKRDAFPQSNSQPGRAAATQGLALYAIADTHLGIRDPSPHSFVDQPKIVGDFLDWLGNSSNVGWNFELPVLLDHSVMTRRLRPASHLILLGDIFQHRPLEDIVTLSQYLWVAESLQSIKAKKILVSGENEISFPELMDALALAGCEIHGEVYPSANDEGLFHPLQIGKRSYMFVHGHQFESILWQAIFLRFPATVRRFGAALGRWAWLFSTSTLIGVLLQWLVSPSMWGWVGVAFGTALLVPALYMRFARSPAVKAVTGVRHKRKRALQGFRSWWKRFHRGVEGTDQLGIIYGHTHFLDWIEVEPSSDNSPSLTRTESRLIHSPLEPKNGPRNLYNLSSWLAGKRRRARTVTWGTIFYADELGPLLLGWDMMNLRPFHIPFEFIRKRREYQPLDHSEISVALELGWPRNLINKWSTRTD